MKGGTGEVLKGIGSRSQHRVLGYPGMSYYTSRTLANPFHSSIGRHAEECGVLVTEESFAFISTSSNTVRLRIEETLCINRFNPSFNDKQTAIDLLLDKK